MNDYKNSNSDAHADQNQALFIEGRVVGIEKQQSEVIGEGGFSVVEAYAMLPRVSLCLSGVLLDPQIGHTYNVLTQSSTRKRCWISRLTSSVSASVWHLVAIEASCRRHSVSSRSHPH